MFIGRVEVNVWVEGYGEIIVIIEVFIDNFWV